MTFLPVQDPAKILCYAITHAGEGERGQWVEILDRNLTPEQCAERAAKYFNDLEMIQDGWSSTDVGGFDGTRSIIEVVGCPYHPEPIRFIVRCEVVRKYEAERVRP